MCLRYLKIHWTTIRCEERGEGWKRAHRPMTNWISSSVTMRNWREPICDRTTSEMRGLSPKIISRDSRRSENAQTHTNKHTISNMKFKLKLLQIKCHVLGFTKDKAQIVLQKIIRVFAEAFISHDRHTLFALEESGPPRTTYTCESQYWTQPSSIWISHWQPSSVSPEEGERTSPAHR
jgi:hypothetical protein